MPTPYGPGDRNRLPRERAPEPRYIDMTPTWRVAAQIIAAALENGTNKGRDAARAELFRMADILDALNAEQKSSQQERQP